MHNLRFCGTIQKGEGIATGLGCPTANVAICEGQLIPALGVYVGEACVDGACYRALVCINDGRQTGKLKMEVHLLGVDCVDFTGKFMEVDLKDKLRGLEKWESDEQIRGLVANDLKNAHEWFADGFLPVDNPNPVNVAQK